jgi:hypothetical protein
VKLKDFWFRGLVIASFVFSSLFPKAIFGEFIYKFVYAFGFISIGTILLSVAIFRAATCLKDDKLDGQAIH